MWHNLILSFVLMKYKIDFELLLYDMGNTNKYLPKNWEIIPSARNKRFGNITIHELRIKTTPSGNDYEEIANIDCRYCQLDNTQNYYIKFEVQSLKSKINIVKVLSTACSKLQKYNPIPDSDKNNKNKKMN